MSTIQIAYVCPTSFLDKGCLELAMLNKKGIHYVIKPRNEETSELLIEGNYHTILESFFIIKDIAIRRIPEIVDTRDDEEYERSIMEIYVSSFIVPSLIGKNGVSINYLRKIAYANVNFEKSDENHSDTQMVTFSGLQEGITQAFETMMLRVLAVFPKLGWVDKNSHRMSYITQYVNPTNIMSKSESYTKFLVMLLNPIVAGYLNDAIEDANNAMNEEQNANDADLSFHVSNKSVGSIIGTGGNKINSIRNETGVRIAISKLSESPKNVRHVTVTGSLEAVSSASGMILECLKNVQK